VLVRSDSMPNDPLCSMLSPGYRTAIQAASPLQWGGRGLQCGGFHCGGGVTCFALPIPPFVQLPPIPCGAVPPHRTHQTAVPRHRSASAVGVPPCETYVPPGDASGFDLRGGQRDGRGGGEDGLRAWRAPACRVPARAPRNQALPSTEASKERHGVGPGVRLGPRGFPGSGGCVVEPHLWRE